MIRIANLPLGLNESHDALLPRAAQYLHLKPESLSRFRLVRKAVDARRRGPVHFVCTVECCAPGEEKLAKKLPNVSLWSAEPYAFPFTAPLSCDHPPVVAGAGPAGLFCALMLARCGLCPILLERGQPVERRQQDVDHFWSGGPLDPESNVQFGEGGAGTFSDGKLTTGTRDARNAFVLQELAAHGAPEEVLWMAKPHIGTDILRDVVRTLRQEILSLGGDIRFGHKLTGLDSAEGALTGIRVTSPEGEYSLPTASLVLALGHSARDSFEMLLEAGLPLEQKPFAVGVRIEHPQDRIDRIQYKEQAGHPSLGAADYKLVSHLDSGRSVFSFCVCPGGTVVAAASEAERLVTNGMSHHARSGPTINGGLLVNITTDDFGSDHPLAGIAFQRKLEEAAFALGGGDFSAPAQQVGDFLVNRPSTGPGSVAPSYRPGVRWTDLRLCLPPFIADALAEALPLLDAKLPGFAAPDAVLTAVESRSSSPVRIPRDESLQAGIRGIFPAGEGAGYAGGILSAAADGIRCAEALCEHLLRRIPSSAEDGTK